MHHKSDPIQRSNLPGLQRSQSILSTSLDTGASYSPPGKGPEASAKNARGKNRDYIVPGASLIDEPSRVGVLAKVCGQLGDIFWRQFARIYCL